MDIVVPVFRALHHVRTCLASLAAWTNDVEYRLIVVDDASGADVNKELSSLIAPWGDQAELLTNPHNQGFLPTANRGMMSGDSPVVAILNTDTYVTPGWLAGLLRCLGSSPTAGIASPLSNYMNLTRLRGHYGASSLLIAEAVRLHTRREYPEIRLASGACMAIRRTVLDEVGYFDPAFGRGYYEETDLCLRAATKGWRTLADDATYVHHHGSGSFGEDEMNELRARNVRIFEERWGKGAKRKIVREVERQQPFADLERRLALGLTYRAQTEPRRPLPRLGRPPRARERALKGQPSGPVQSRPTWQRRTYQEWRAIAMAKDDIPPPSDSSLLLLVDDLRVNPWTSDVMRIADLLLEIGIDVNVATSGLYDPYTLVEPCRLSPYVLAGPDELLEVVRPHHWVVATSPSTVYDALLLRERDGSRVASWFQPEAMAAGPLPPGDGPALSAAFGLVSMHLHAGEMFATGSPTIDVPIGVDLDFYATALERAAGEVLLVNGTSGFHGAAETVAHQLDQAGISLTVYGEPINGVDPTRIQPLLPRSEEAKLLQSVTVVAELSPIIGLERFRLRVAAAGTPLVVGCPTASSCRLSVGTDVYGASWGDAARLVQLVQELVGGGGSPTVRADAAAAKARRSPLSQEAKSIAEALHGTPQPGLGARPDDPRRRPGPVTSMSWGQTMRGPVRSRRSRTSRASEWAGEGFAVLLGHARSGTTVLARALGSHPEIGYWEEPRLLYRIERKLGWLEPIAEHLIQDAAVKDLARSERDGKLREQFADEIAASRGEAEEVWVRAVRHLVASLRSDFLARSGGSILLQKTPREIALARQTRQWFPDAKLIHIVRDARDVVCSGLSWEQRWGRPGWVPKQGDLLDAITTQWAAQVGEAFRSSGPDTLVVRYEDLAQRGRPVVEACLEHLGLPWHREVGRFLGSGMGGLHANSTGRWRTDLDQAQRARVEELAGETLRRAGYA